VENAQAQATLPGDGHLLSLNLLVAGGALEKVTVLPLADRLLVESAQFSGEQ